MCPVETIQATGSVNFILGKNILKLFYDKIILSSTFFSFLGKTIHF
jgi:hypothetical protein